MTSCCSRDTAAGLPKLGVISENSPSSAINQNSQVMEVQRGQVGPDVSLPVLGVGSDASMSRSGFLHTHPTGKRERVNDLPGGFTALLHGDLIWLPLVLGQVNFLRHQRVGRGVPEDLRDR